MKGSAIIRDWVDGGDGVDVDELYRDLALHYSAATSSNQKRLNRLYRLYASALLLAVGSVVSFALAVA